VYELLDDLDRGRRLDPAVAVGRQQPAAGRAQRVLVAHRVAEDRGVEDDQLSSRSRAASSSRRSSAGSAGTVIASAARTAGTAARRRSPWEGSRSIASRTMAATETPRRSASRATFR